MFLDDVLNYTLTNGTGQETEMSFEINNQIDFGSHTAYCIGAVDGNEDSSSTNSFFRSTFVENNQSYNNLTLCLFQQ